MRRFLLLILLVGIATQAKADALVVAVCGTLPMTYAVGSTQKITVDVNGNTCI